MADKNETLTEAQREEMLRLDAEIERAKRYREILQEETKAIETVYQWKAPERLFSPKSREWYVTISGIAVVAIALSALTDNFGLVIAIIAVVFLIYTLNTTPPRIVTHEITNKGLKIDGALYLWRMIEAFWVVRRDEQMIMHFDVRDSERDPVSRRMILLEGEGDINYIVSYLVQHIDYLTSREASTGFLTRLIIGRYQPLLPFLEGREDINTKDPKDNPKILRESQAQQPETTQKEQQPAKKPNPST